MAVGDGITWNEAVPDDNTLANQIDDYDRDLRVGVRSRMAREHVWPSSQTATNEGGHHNYITFQAQTAAPTLAGTTAGGIWVSTGTNSTLNFVNSAGTNVVLVNTAGVMPVISGGTQGGIVIASSASPTAVTVLAASADGLYLKTQSTTGAPKWEAVTSLDAAIVVSGTFGVERGGTGQATTGLAHGGKVVAYTGNGTDNRDIAHGLGRTPVLVMILCDGASQPLVIWMTGFANGISAAGVSEADSIQAVDGTNVNLGTSAYVNANSTTYKMFVI